MSKISLIFAILSLCVLQNANAADGVINFSGNITGTACVVDTSAIAQPVNLGTVSATAFANGSGATAAATRFSIVLTACPESISGANIRFDGVANSINPSILALNMNATASNVGVAIYENDSTTLIPVGTPSARVTLLPDTSNTLNYIAKYMATGVVGTGTADSVTSFTVTYQ
ncbi:TPA: fimbrial protein [Morganella morganii]|uniref:fimbrial protein n=1 Tax=Morganella morganii TaxID=582 RepID=UPI00229C7359|nr:fimbrial protein [Morganella morganii]